MKVDFLRKKYDRELLIDCFEMRENLNVNKSTQPFWVTFYEIIFFTSGFGEFRIDEEIVSFKKGTVLLLPPNKWRQWLHLSDDTDALFLIFEEEFISRFFNDALYLYRFAYFYNTDTPSYVNLTDCEMGVMSQKLMEVQQELKSLKDDSRHFLRALLYYILIQLNREYQTAHSISKTFYREQLVLQFRKLLEKHIIEKQRVVDYAQLLQVSTSHLNKKLKLFLGKNCSELIKERLLLEIKKQLLFSKKTISEISYGLNFSEPSNFNRFFHTMTKMTPKQFRLENDNS
ncbi:AraC family transcriptional regulator [Allomuricauda sp. d1]|uniref:AraC family transcriptional regulator n=1 Tax=Allomuricauda sp. d1 TaxID=3136725 RepID=UPI0031D0545C